MEINSEQGNKLNFFFIIGRPRSGTTLLRTLFDAHPNVNIPLECAYINNLYLRYGSIKRFSKKNILEFYNDLKKQKTFTWSKFDEKKMLSDMMTMENKADFNDICALVASNYISPFKKDNIEILGDKNPVYSFYTKRLIKVFPDAKFIYITRDYRDNMLSILKRNISMKSVLQIVWQWKYAAKLNSKIIQQYPEKFYSVRYEDFVAEPQKHFSEMCGFLGINFHEGVFDFYKDTEAKNQLYTEKFIENWQKNLFEPISTKNIGRWKNELSEEQIKKADAVVGSVADKIGYERRFKNSSFLFKLSLLPGIGTSHVYNALRIIKDKFIFKTENSE